MIITPIIFLLCIRSEATYSTAQFKIFRGEADNYTEETLQREKDLQYPGTNRKLLKDIQHMWTIYYKCLIEYEWNIKKPEIRRLLEGQYTELHCPICPRPFQNYDELEWKYKPLEPDSHLEHLDLTPEMTYTPYKTIRIFNAMENLKGLYVCYQKQNLVSVYILEVSKNDTIQKVDTIRDEISFSVKSHGKNFQVSYRWTQWTECSTCGRIGNKYRYGTCYVSSEQDDLKYTKGYKKGNKKSSQHHKKGTRKSKTKTGTSNKTLEGGEGDLEIVERFSTGIPCASRYLPKPLLEVVQDLDSMKVVVKLCWEPCREIEIFEVLDTNGNIVEWANNTAGIYSLFQKIPQIPHDIERRSITADFGTNIIIQCPGTSFRNSPIVWKVNNRIIFPDVVAKQSNGRFTIDLVNRINLKKLRLKDSRIYSCWQKEKLVGTVNLNVEKKFKIVFDHHVTLITIIALSGLFLLIGSKMIGWELRQRKI